jgi:hypothetical protein
MDEKNKESIREALKKASYSFGVLAGAVLDCAQAFAEGMVDRLDDDEEKPK